MKKNSKLRKFVSQALVLALVLTQFQVVAPKPVLATWISGTLDFSNLTPYSVTLSWAAATNGGDTGYRVYQDSMFIFETSGTIYDVTGLTPNTTYMFKIEAMDTNGFWSTDGPTVSVTTLQDAAPAGDTVLATQLVWAIQPGNAQVNAPLDPQPVLYLEDVNGNVVTGDSSSTVTLLLTTPGGATLGGTNAVTLNAGVATFTDLSVDLAGTYTLTPTIDLANIACPPSNSSTITDVQGDNTPPSVSSTSPANLASSVPITSIISVIFSEDVLPASNFTNIAVYSGGQPIALSSPAISANVLTIPHVNQFVYDSDYTVVIPAGSVMDAAGNDLSADYTFQFTTGTTPSPAVSFPDPNLADAVRSELGLAADAPITLADISTLTSLSSAERTITNLTGLEYATNLTYLDLSFNQITSISPLGSLTGLTELNLRGNSIDNISPLSTLTSLTCLHLEENQVTDLSPLTELSSLTVLGLYDNQIADIAPLSALLSLTYLDLGNNQIKDISPVSELTGLTELYLNNNQVTDLSPLTGLTNLSSLYLSNNLISYILPLAVLHQNGGLPGYGARVTVAGDVQIPTGSVLSITGNFIDISAGSDSLSFLQALMADGVTVDYIPQITNTEIASTVPAANSQGADIDTGIDIAFQDIISPGSNIGSISIAAVDGTVVNYTNLTNSNVLHLSPTYLLRDTTYIVTIPDGAVTLPGSVANTVYSFNFTTGSDIVSFPDANLAAAIRSELGLAAGDPITQTELLSLTSLSAGETGTSELTGLEHALNLSSLNLSYNNNIADLTPLSGLTGLQSLELGGNKISDISPLSGLTSVNYLTLERNQISDISPLVINNQNGGFVSTSYVDITYNNLDLSAGSSSLIAIQDLLNSGVDVYYDPQNDTTPPTITGTDPADAAADISVYSRVEVYFSEFIEQGPNFSGISLKAGSTSIGINPVLDGDLFIEPVSDLDYSTAYTVYLPAGAVQDQAGNALASDYTFQFTTGGAPDIAPPTVTNIETYPLVGEFAPVDSFVTVTFSESVTQGPNFSDISLNTGDTVVNLIPPDLNVNPYMELFPSTTLEYSTTYTITIPAGAVQDLSGNLLTNDYTYQFTTADPATVTFTDPNLEAVIRQALNIPSGDIPTASLSTLTNLSAGGQSIVDLTGLQYAKGLLNLDLNSNQIIDLSPLSGITALTSLDLATNNISDLSPLSGLIQLTTLYLNDNQITDISPLIVNNQNGGLVSGSNVNITYNFLDFSADSSSYNALQSLITRSVNVIYDPQNDITPPTWPNAALTETGLTYNSATLKWTPADDNAGIVNYYIYQNGTLTYTAAGSANSYHITGLTPSTTYTFRLVAADAAGNMTDGPSMTIDTLPIIETTGITLNKKLIGLSPNMTARHLTRAEAVNFIVHSFDLLDMEAWSNFTDVQATDPYFHEISSAVVRGITSGYPDQTFQPDWSLTRAEFAAMLVRASGYPLSPATTSFLDMPSEHWAAQYVATAIDAGFLQGDPDGYFRPDEAAVMDTSGKLIARIEPFDATNKKVIWSSSNTDIATVDQTGQVSGLASGSAVITDITEDGSFTASCEVVVSDGVVTFQDSNLEAAVLDALNQTTVPVALADLYTLTNLNAANREIMNLTGLEKALNLTNLNLSQNQISILDPLIDFKNLTVLNLSYNRLTDVMPLVINSETGGLKSGSYVDVTYNLLDLWEGSSSYYDLQYLVSSGIDVSYEPQSPALTPPSGPRMAYIPNFNSNTVTVVDLGKQSVARTVYGFNRPWAVAVNPSGNKVYVTNTGNDSISVIDPFSLTVTDTIFGISSPLGAALNPDGTKLYVTNFGEGTVSVINTATNQLIGSPIPVGLNPRGIIVSPFGPKVYVANGGSNNVSIIDAATDEVLSNVTVGNNPYGLDVAPDGSRVYVTNSDSSAVSVIETGSETVTYIPVGTSNQAIVISPNGQNVYTANSNTGKISIIDTSTNTVTGYVYAGTNPSGISISPGGGLLAVANYGSNDLSIFDVKSLTLLKNVPVGTNPGAFGKFIKMFPPTRAYIPNNSEDTVSVIDAFTDHVDTIINTTPVGSMPYGVAISPDMERAYITNSGGSTLSVIDIETNKVISTLPVGSGPKGVAADPQGTRVYVANEMDNSITIINASENAVISTIPLPSNSNPQGIAVSPGGGRIFTSNTGNNSVSVVSTLSNTVKNTVYGFSQPYSFAVVGDGSYVYVTNSGANTVSMLDTRKFQIVDTINVGTNPTGITATRDGSKLYVANYYDNTVTVIDAAYHLNAVIDTINVGSGPMGIAITPDNSQVFVVNSGDNTVSLIDTTDNTVAEPINVGYNPIALGQFIGLGLKSRLTPPAVGDALAIGYQVKLSYDRILDETSIPAASDFSVTVASAPAAVSKVTVLGARVDLTLSAPIISGQIMTVDYTPGISPVREVAGLPSAGFTGLNVETDRPILKTAFAESGNNLLNLYYSEPLVEDFGLSRYDFNVKINGTQVTVLGAQVFLDNVLVDIGQTIGADQNVSIDYTPGLYPLRNAAGVLAAPLTDQLVDIIAPDSYEPDNDYTSAGLIPTDGTAQTHTILSIPNGDIDWMKFEAIAGAEYVIKNSQLSPTMLPSVSVYNFDGTTNVSYHPTDPSWPINWVAPTQGTHYIKVEHASNWVGRYAISIYALPYPLKTSDIGLPIDSPITIPFSENITEGHSFQYISLMDSLTEDLITSNFSIIDNNLIVSPASALNYGSSYVVMIPPGALANTQGDLVSAADYNFIFTTEHPSLPPVIDTTPPDWADITLNIYDVTQNSASLSWEAPADPDDAVVMYAVYLNGELLGDTTDTYFDVNGLTPDSYYSISVRAIDSYGNWSTDLVASLSTALPTWSAGALNVAEITSTGLTLSWTSAYDSFGPIVAYSVYQNRDLLKTADGSLYTYDISGLSPNTSYTFKIEAMNSFGLWSTTGPEKTVTTLSPPDMIMPTVISANPVNSSTDVYADNQITIKFSEDIQPGNSIGAIKLTTGDSNMAVDFEYDVTGDTLTLIPTPGLATSTTYYVSIPADAVADSGNNSLESNYTFSFTTAITKDGNLENLLRTLLNKPSGPITPEDMLKLEVLKADDSYIYDLSGLEHAVNLKRLYLGNNIISDLGPISQLTGLEELWLNNNQINDISYLSGLTKLKWLYLNQNYISSIEPLSDLGEFGKLEVLYLNDNDITDVSWLDKLTSLLSLGLGYNKITDISQLGSLNKLQMLDLQSQGQYESIAYRLSDISAVAYMPELHTLLLNDNAIHNLTSLQGLTTLTKLTLWNNGISDSDSGGITPLQGLKALTDLWLDNNNIRSLTPLKDLTSLKVLSLAGNNNISDFSALVNNTGLGTGDHVDLPTTVSDTYLQSLTNKSITVSKR